ncbi:MAG TPA: HEAT repeat domain-containing protein [Kofleriaceae bacterium]|nr:HEAT repeat domain-containing protein [Kofleriaceae bacterium]
MFGLFSKERGIARARKKALNKLAQSPERWAAMEKLRDDGSDESLLVLCRRFGITSSKMVEDQQEKEWVVEALTGKGEAVLPALRSYLAEAESLAYPLRVLESVAKGADVLEIVDAILVKEPPEYTRDPGRKLDVINFLGEHPGISNQEAITRVLPYLGDYDENVRYAAVTAIGLRPTPDAAAPLVNALLRPGEESRRLKLRIGEVLAEADLDLAGRKDEVAALFDDILVDYRLHRDHLVRKNK